MHFQYFAAFVQCSNAPESVRKPKVSSENQRFSDVFRGYRIGTLGENAAEY